MPQLSLFPVRTSPLARRSHPETSKAAASALLANPRRLTALQQHALDMVRRYPGRTAQQLAEFDNTWDPRPIGRRLSELRDCSPALVKNGPVGFDARTGRPAQTWRPA